ncbi:MAG: lipid-A-disaccharide synthase [Acidobacteriia bacterium]|nr:lipid-A-disaccharide synthase [Terriglobia bacterium]
MANTCLMMVAGERSGDVYGAELAKALRARLGPLEIFGCGGDAMREASVQTTIDAHRVSVAGIVEVLAGLPRVYRAFQTLLAEVERRRPQLAVLIDFPDFNLRMAKRLRKRGIPVVYFVSPQIWAWRSGRIKKIKAYVSRMLCIFDFEEEIYRRAGVPVDYVGHPLADLVRAHTTREEFFAKAGLDPALTTIALLPGSRQKEVAMNLPPMLGAASRLGLSRRLQFVLPVAPSLDPVWVNSIILATHVGKARVRTVIRATSDALEHADMAVVASGTATLEAALHARPMVVVYRVSTLTWLFGKLLVKVPHYSMVNLLAGKQVVPELMQSKFNPRNLATQLEYLLDHPQARATMVEDLKSVRGRLGPGGAAGRAAEAVIRTLGGGGEPWGPHQALPARGAAAKGDATR